MDLRVEKLEVDVNSLTIGQQQIRDKLNELSVQFNTRASSQPTNGQPDLEEGDDDMVMEEEDTEQTSLNDRPKISLHSILGSPALETMRVRGTIERISTIVLVDSGSTHKFISEVLAKKVAYNQYKEDSLK
ncbi:hypothetical protein F0562_013953 [Nyssa sinensis]|uniref:Uncharacterized protein n=1 Tax=Nyssa sinensis TaxID=561372 RepID=A0A5J4ZQ84_9ASTE|nr:hypothetical protein F0562_013953 [Nyssa sinensis]